MLNRFPTILQHNCQIVASKLSLVGVSGGPDSLCLLDLLRGLGYPVVVAHFNHGLRQEAVGEARHVEEIADRMGVPFIAGSEDVAAYASTESLSLEEAARLLRYRFLFKEAKRLGAQAVLVGHNADDQVETVLMHLMRGAGMDGLLGMDYHSLPNPWSATIPLVRPLLAFWREEILAYVEMRGLQPNQDSSNLDTTFFRNRLRHQLIPALEQHQPNIRRSIWRTAEVLREESRILEDLVQAAWKGCILDQGSNYLAFDSRSWSGQPVAIQRRLLRNAISVLRPGLSDVDFETIERGRSYLIDPDQGGTCNLAAGLSLRREGQITYLASWEAELPSASWPQMPMDPPELHLNLPGVINLQGDWTLEARVVESASGISYQVTADGDPWVALMDADAIPGALVIRRRRAGDRIKPFGMLGHSMKISDLMLNSKIPRRLRLAWPLVCAAGEVVWVPGCRQADAGRITTSTRRVVELILKKGTRI